MESASRNEVLLVGRLAAEPEERSLPSGDVLATFRLVVDRPPTARSAGARGAAVDTLDCVARAAAVRRAALGWRPGPRPRVSEAPTSPTPRPAAAACRASGRRRSA